MDDLTHNPWATPQDIALQQTEFARRRQQEAQAHETTRHQQDSNSLNGLEAQVGDPAQIQAGVDFRHMQRRLHEAEQALAAERTLRVQQHAPPRRAPPAPPPPQCPQLPHHPQARVGEPGRGQVNSGRHGTQAFGNSRRM